MPSLRDLKHRNSDINLNFQIYSYTHQTSNTAGLVITSIKATTEGIERSDILGKTRLKYIFNHIWTKKKK